MNIGNKIKKIRELKNLISLVLGCSIKRNPQRQTGLTGLPQTKSFCIMKSWFWIFISAFCFKFEFK